MSVQLPEWADVVVVGVGTAGAVVAGRLAERGDRDVLALEAGPDYGPREAGRWPVELLDSRRLPETHDWGYAGASTSGDLLTFSRARVVGGCSSHNGCSQSIGWRGDYDRWSRSGLTGWSAEDLTPLLHAAVERMQVNTPAAADVQPLQRAVLDAAVAAGVPAIDDLLSFDGEISVSQCPVNVVDNSRWNASFGYLDPVRTSGRLQVIGDVVVVRVAIKDGHAVGVDVLVDGAEHRIGADLVVLSAGVYGTVEVLQRSGVGPAAELARLGVNVQIDAPGVGANLHDHPVATLEFEASESLAAELAAFAADRPLAEEGAIAKLRSSVADGPYDLHVFPWIEPLVGSATGWKCVFPVGLLTPLSRGRVRLSSADPTVRASVDHAYLDEPQDVQAISDGLREVREWLTQPELSRMLAAAVSVPGAYDDVTLHAWIRRIQSHYWHPAGTAAMGAAETGGVTDGDGRVHGIDGLVVADASIFPELPRATPALPVVVAGERIARTIA
ncbi:MAG TPA: GMC family oxidoreductase [Actinomycetes bacterium]|nr:GMC family oxidoreductase [Actinomycetes bacterium]